MTACTCKPLRKPPVQRRELDKYLWIQRPKLAADGATENTHGIIDYTLDANWVNVGRAWFALRPMRGRQVDIAGQIVDTVIAQGWTQWDNLTSAMTPDMRLILGDDPDDTTTRKVYQIAGMIDWYEANEWIGTHLAEFKIEH